MGSWRYQPVRFEDDGIPLVGLVRAHFDDVGSFDKWSEDICAPAGDDLEELTRDINRMLVDSICWEPVNYVDLHAGMSFMPRVSMEDRNAVAKFVLHSTEAMKRQPKPQRN